VFIKGIKISIETDDGPYGFLAFFNRNLNIIRGRNSAGKSTIVQSILYALGMEQILGAQNDKALTYVLKEYVDNDGLRCNIIRSWVSMEMESFGKTITVTRKIKDKGFDTRLVEVQECAGLTDNQTAESRFLYLHDGGSAIYNDGYYTYLEKFLGLNLPSVPDKNGNPKKLYLQYVFAAMAIEQKRGWTDYIANLPYFGIRDARIKVVDYLVGTDVFELETEKARLDVEALTLHNLWSDITKSIHSDALKNLVKVAHLPQSPVKEFDPYSIQLFKVMANGSNVALGEHKRAQVQTLTKLHKEETTWKDTAPAETLRAIDAETEHLQRLTVAYESSIGDLTLHRASKNANLQHIKQAEDELIKNEVTHKLVKYGASLDLNISKNVCPACYQNVGESLIDLSEQMPHMDIETNIDYLKSQITMLKRDNAAIDRSMREVAVTNESFAKQIADSKSRLRALRSDLTTTSVVSKANMRLQLQIEINLEDIGKFSQRIDEHLSQLVGIAEQFATNQKARAELPSDIYSEDDLKKYDLFEKFFRSYVGEFDYQSAPVKDVKFNIDNLLPELEKIELREIQNSKFSEHKKASIRSTSRDSSNIASESSASDFVRLIWSYILSIYETSVHETVKGNHPGFLLFDEPGQHSMATKSQRALFKCLNKLEGLQSIVAASFDDSEAAYLEATADVTFKLIKLGKKAIVPDGDTTPVGDD
jgi:hypothetical protein